MGAAGFVPTCPSLNPSKEEKTVDRNLIGQKRCKDTRTTEKGSMGNLK